MRFIPDDPVVYSAPSDNMAEAEKIFTSKLVNIALDVASGLRPLAHLSPKFFDPSISTHLSSWTRTHKDTRNTRMWMKSLHGSKDGEFFGNAILSDKQFDYTGRLSKELDNIRSFRLIYACSCAVICLRSMNNWRTVSSLMPSFIALNISPPSFWYSTKGSRCAIARRPMPSLR